MQPRINTSTCTILSHLTSLNNSQPPKAALATEEDIVSFFSCLVVTLDQASCKKDADAIRFCKAKYLLYLRHTLTSGEYTRWHAADESLLVSAIKALAAQGKIKNLEPAITNKIIDEIKSPANYKINLAADEKLELLELIENIENYGLGIKDLNVEFKAKKDIISAHNCRRGANSVAKKGP